MKCTAAKFVHLLTNEQKWNSVSMCQGLQQKLQKDPEFPCNFHLFSKIQVGTEGEEI
jgi:hypothetical protein